MVAVGYFPLNTDYSNRIIYQKPSTSPTTSTTTPIYRAPVSPAPPPRGVPVPTTVTPIPMAKPYTGGIITTMAPAPTPTTTGTGTTTGTTGGTTGGTTATGTETSGGGGGGGGVDTRLLDLLGGAFQSQPLQQGFAPQSVSSDALAPSSKGTNPMAVVVLAIFAMVGIYLWTHRKRGAA